MAVGGDLFQRIEFELAPSVLCIPAYLLTQGMLAANRGLELPQMFRKLVNFDLRIIDDLGYLPLGPRGPRRLSP